MGEIIHGEMHLNAYGQIVAQAWLDLPQHYPYMFADAFIIMPDHVHMVIGLLDRVQGVETGLRPVSTTPVSEIIRAFKSFSARRINQLRQTPGTRVWQPRYHDRIVRDSAELERIRIYIERNPEQWAAHP